MSAHKLVPVEPTPEMLAAAHALEDQCAVENYGGSPAAADTYAVMLAAAPEVAQPEQKPVAWKSGGEFAPYHPQASHVSPDYRDGWNHCYAAAKRAAPQPDAVRELVEALQGLLDDIRGLMEESEGVAGLHRNGDVADWDSLAEGGSFERLSHLSAADAALAKHGKEGAK